MLIGAATVLRHHEVPGEIAGVVGISATGYYNQKAYYSNYGVGKADVSASGGDARTQFAPPNYRGLRRVLGAWSHENTGGAVFLEEGCDPISGCGAYAWVRGTSMATPNASALQP